MVEGELKAIFVLASIFFAVLVILFALYLVGRKTK